jgi:hypothetical protein
MTDKPFNPHWGKSPSKETWPFLYAGSGCQPVLSLYDSWLIVLVISQPNLEKRLPAVSQPSVSHQPAISQPQTKWLAEFGEEA